MRYILLLLFFVYNVTLAQQKERTISISCYVNAELYLQAGVMAHVSDKTGNISCNGRYVTISNKSGNAFYYKSNNRWVLVKPQGRAVIMLTNATTASSKAASVFKLTVKYSPVAAGNLSARIKTISQMNAQSDRVKARELEGDDSGNKDAAPPGETLAKVNKPSTTPAPANLQPKTEATIPKKAVAAKPETQPKQTRSAPEPERKRVVAKAAPKAKPQHHQPGSGTRKVQRSGYGNAASATAIGLRVDFGRGATGLGPNIKHRFNRNFSLDAAVVFFEGDLIGLGAQFEKSFPAKGTPALDWYIGIGPQFLLADEHTAIALVPVTGLEYRIPSTPLNLSFDWRPNFYLSPATHVAGGRFGFSIRIAL